MPVHSRIIAYACLFLLVASAWTQQNANIPPFYEKRVDHDPNGTGIFFMGREVAHVCQGGEWLERPQRELEENVELLVELLKLRPGEMVADVGAGTGYISRKLAKRVTPSGKVYAVEIQQEMLTTLTNKAAEVGITNIVPVLGKVSDPRLPEASIDTILLVDVYHEFDRPYEMVQQLGKALKPGGRIVFVEYRAEDPKVPIKSVHKMSVDQVKKEMSVHPFTWVESIEELPWQHMIVFRKGLLTSRDTIVVGNEKLPSLEQALDAPSDVWGEAAIRQTNGPTYEFFRDLLPPLRYVNTAFRHYPIVLSAPCATNKARFISNGSGVNLRAELRHVWKDVGIPISFYVGQTNEPFGSDLRRLTGPTYERGHLPIVKLTYSSDGVAYNQECFAATSPELANVGAVFVTFSSPKDGKVSARIDAPDQLTFSTNAIVNAAGQTLLYADGQWIWDSKTKSLSVQLTKTNSATLTIFSKPSPIKQIPARVSGERVNCIKTWEQILAQGTEIDVPEPYVNSAWKSSVIGNYMLLAGDAPNYSAHNQYERLYEAECGDTTRAMMLFGQSADARRMVVPCLDYARKGLYFHQAAFKLQLLAHYYWITRDKAFIAEQCPRWSKEVSRLIEGREKESGLLPKEQYAGDIFEDVYTLNSNANGSKALRDMAAVLIDIGEAEEAKRLQEAGDALRKATLAAVEKSIYTNTKPPFIPLALFGYEKPYERISASKLGSYWNEMTGYVLCSDLFGLNSERETQMLEYQYQHGGIAMGMVRFHQHSGLFANEFGVDDLYGLRHTEKLLQRDDADRALVSFYGKLAQGMTRDTFIGAEGTSFRALDEFGRPMYLPPNSTANAFFLWTLRGILVQDLDSNDDCQPDTLRLLFATPKRWLEDGKTISVENAPTAFGNVSLKVSSSLKDRKIFTVIKLPSRNSPKHTFLRLRVPDGYQVESASFNGKRFNVDSKGTIDLQNLRGEVRGTVSVKKR